MLAAASSQIAMPCLVLLENSEDIRKGALGSPELKLSFRCFKRARCKERQLSKCKAGKTNILPSFHNLN